MFGTNLAGTRGKTVWQKSDGVVMYYVTVPKDLLELHKFVTLVAYLMFVNGATFLIIMSLGINFVTVKHIPTCTDKQMSKSLKRVMKIYSRSSMIIKTVRMDMEFNKTIDDLV